MKQFYFKSIFLSLLMMVTGMNVASAADTWVKTDPSELVTGDVVVIVDLTTSMAMSNDKGTSAAPVATTVSLLGNQSQITSDVGANLKWEVTVDNGSYKFGVTSGETTNYLYCTNTNNGVRVGTNENNTFTFENDPTSTFNSSDKYLKNVSTSRFLGVYNNVDWRCYGSVNSNIQNTKTAFYKKVESSTPAKILTGLTLSGTYLTTFNVGDTFSHEGMTVTATYDDNTSEDVTAYATFDGYNMSTAGTQTVTVSYMEREVTKTATYNITVNALTGDAYTLVTSVDDLADGDNIIIVNTGADKAMGGQNNNNRAATEVTFNEDGDAIVPSSTEIQVFTLEGNSTGWYFYTGSGYLYASSNSSNQLKTEAEKDKNNNAKASISISDGDATITFLGNNSHNLLKYNSDNDIFACYTSGQSPVQIYRKPVNKTLTGIMLSGEYPTTFFMGDEFSFGETGTVTAVYDDNSTKVVTELATFSGYEMNTAGNQTVTVSYTERGVTKEETYEITVNNRALSRITLSGDYPTTFNVGDDFSHEGMTVIATYDDNTSEDVTADATFEGYDMSTAGTQTVTVSYTKADVTKTATYEITVNAVAVTGITLNKEAIQLKVGKTTKLTATVTPDNATDKTVVWSSGDETVATVSEDGTVTAVAEGTATITAGTPDGAKTAACTVTVIAATAPTEYYEKVTSAPEDWSGEYLIVYETGKVAFDGSLSTLDAEGNTIEVEINNEMIEATEDVNDAAFTIATMEGGGYSVKAASGKFIGATSYANSLASSDSEIANSLSLDASGNAVIKVTTSGGDVTLRYNYGSNQLRFRYYKSGQQAIQLYKKATGPKSPLAGIRVEGYKTDFVVGDTYTFDGTVTAVYEDDTEKDVTNRATFTKPDMTTAGEDVGVTVSYTEGEVTAEETIYINVREPQTIKFRKITSTDELVPGKRYVLVNEEAEKVIAEYYNLHFNVNDAPISDERVTLAENQANILTLGVEEGAWTFATSIETGKYLYFNTPGDDSNYLNLGDDATALGSQWTISFDEKGNAVIQTNYNKETNNPDRYIRYNPTQPRFACYKGTQKPVQLYVESDLEDVTLTITPAGYATLYYSDRALKVPEGVTAKTYKVVDGKLAESKTYASGSKIPKGEAVVLKGAPGEYTFKVTSTAEPKDADNQLKGSDEAERTTGGTYYYALQAKSKDGKHGPGMYWMNSTGEYFTNGAHKAYMALDETFAEAQGMAKEFYLFVEATTGISGIDAASADPTEMYNLNGQRVDRGYKGVVIKNGKKIVIK